MADTRSPQTLPHAQDVARAAEVLRAGGLVAFPTETVYGLGADARRADAVARIFAAKGRPTGHPLIVHLADARALDEYAREIPSVARRLADAFWPGPLTLVLRRSDPITSVATGGLDTVGLRVPAHDVARALLTAFGGPIAAPSANRFGSVSPTTAADVREDLGGRVDLVLDGGPCQVGVESTIVDLTGHEPRLLRPGGVPREAIEALLGATLRAGPAADGAQRASGLLASHYAPSAEVRVVEAAALAREASAAIDRGQRVAVLSLGHAGALPDAAVRFELGPAAEDAARALYATLREADRRGCDLVLAALPDEVGLGLAVADRLRRAAGPRAR